MWFTSFVLVLIFAEISGALTGHRQKAGYDSSSLVPPELSPKPENGTDENIVGGSPINIQDAPWQVVILRDGLLYCGGVILTPNIVLTAQHCIAEIAEDSFSLAVVAGVTDLNDFSSHRQQSNVQDVVAYPNYLTFELGKDVALLVLRYPIHLDGVRTSTIGRLTVKQENAGLLKPTALVDRQNPEKWATTALVSGWGDTLDVETTILQEVSVPIVSNNDATELYGQKITNDQLAAGAGGRDACFGDSGGPLTVPGEKPQQQLLAGLVSWGKGCAIARYPGLYSRVSSFNAWINHMLPLASKPLSFVALPIIRRYVIQKNIKTNQWARRSIEIPRGLRRLEIMIDGARSGDVDLYISSGEGNPVTKQFFSCSSVQPGSSEGCLVSFPISGVWNIGVYSFSQTLFPSISINFFAVNVQDVTITTNGALQKDERNTMVPLSVHPGRMFTANLTVLSGSATIFLFTQDIFRTVMRTKCREREVFNPNQISILCNLIIPPSVTKAWVSVRGRSFKTTNYKLTIDAATHTPFEPYVQNEQLREIVHKDKIKEFGPYKVQPGTEFAISFRVFQGFADLALQAESGSTNSTSPSSLCSLTGRGTSDLCSLIVPEGMNDAFIRVSSNSESSLFNLVVTYIKP
jgi:trypsin